MLGGILGSHFLVWVDLVFSEGLWQARVGVHCAQGGSVLLLNHLVSFIHGEAGINASGWLDSDSFADALVLTG